MVVMSYPPVIAVSAYGPFHEQLLTKQPSRAQEVTINLESIEWDQS